METSSRITRHEITAPKNIQGLIRSGERVIHLAYLSDEIDSTNPSAIPTQPVHDTREVDITIIDDLWSNNGNDNDSYFGLTPDSLAARIDLLSNTLSIVEPAPFGDSEDSL